VIVLAALISVLYWTAAVIIGLYSVSQLHLLWRARSLSRADLPPVDGPELPAITVQLPLYDERRVVRSLLLCIGELDWPRLTIQVLDDSTDETVQIAATTCAELQAAGVNAQHMRRPDRTGYKAGALAWGLRQTSDEYIAIFDADFRPSPDFLRLAMAQLLADQQLGLIQARWTHINRSESPFTEVLAFHMDAHFSIEQVARSRAPMLMGFNGTAGVWRKCCIEAGGGWSGDTLTEDLDLSFRSQLAGWQLGYLDTLEAPAELPAQVQAIRSQQHRWMKGGAQVARKLLRTLWASDRTFLTKLQGTVHLCGGAVFIAVLALCITSPALPPLIIMEPNTALWLTPASFVLQGALAGLTLYYGAMCWRREPTIGRGLLRLMTTLPLFLSLSTGLSLHNSVAVVEGWLGVQSPFVRTPKRGDASCERPQYTLSPPGWATWAEVGMAVWSGVGVTWAIGGGQWVLATFLISQTLGFGAVALGSLLQR
jgi:cellulose synthase/poly-beta-1,6-N-acetylglucosamine synthase-like glycosyltransferase